MRFESPVQIGTRVGVRRLVRDIAVSLGRQPMSAARYLDRKGLAVRVADTRTNPPGVDALHDQVPAAELRTAAAEQAKITALRLRKLLASSTAGAP